MTLSDPDAGLGAGDIVSLNLNNPLFFDADGNGTAQSSHLVVTLGTAAPRPTVTASDLFYVT